MLPVRTRVYGKKTTNCPSPVRFVPCYEPCEHTDFVVSQALPFIGDPFYLESLLRGQLKVAEKFLAELCQPLDICKLGEILGFPCVQCGYVVQPAFSICPNESFHCGDSFYTTLNPSQSICAPLCNDKCITGAIDFSTAEDSFALYFKIATALKSFKGNANWSGLDEFVKLVFGDNANLVTFKEGIYYLDVGRALSNFEFNALNIIKRVFPAPIGADIIFVEGKYCGE